MDRVDQQVSSRRQGLADEPLGGPDALARHTLGQLAVPSAGATVVGAVGEAAVAAAAAVQQAAAATAEAAKSAAAAAAGAGQDVSGSKGAGRVSVHPADGS